MSREVLIVCADLSRNAAGRAVVLAELVGTSRGVTIMGSASGPIWLPLRDRRDLKVEVLGNRWLPDRRTRRRLRDATVIAGKPLVRSWGWALLSGARRGVLDIDDPEIALARMDLRTLARSTFSLESIPLTAALLRARRWATAITVASGELKRRYGGVVIPHARNERLFASDGMRSRSDSRDALGLDRTRPLVAFVGTMRAHKGAATLLRAARLMPEVDVAIVGSARVGATAGNVHFVEALPYAAALQWIAAADVVVVPQSDGAIGRAQSPAKVVDAMAMGRAIVASELPPIVELGGSAIRYVRPGDPVALAHAVQALLADPDARERLEVLARDRFLQDLSIAAVRPRMSELLAAVDATPAPDA